MKKAKLIFLLIILLGSMLMAAKSTEASSSDSGEKSYPLFVDAIRGMTGTGEGDAPPHFVIFLGRFHPLILHIPIGLIVGVLLLEAVVFLKKRKDEGFDSKSIDEVSSWLCILGGITATVAVILGWFLSSPGEYDADLLARHGYIGGLFAILFFVMYFVKKKALKVEDSSPNAFRGVLVANLIVLSIAGHDGGSLTHGEEYLFEHAPDFVRKMTGRPPKPIPKKVTEDSDIFQEVIVSLMNQRCTSCHGPEKDKGGLRVDTHEFMLKGGDDEGPSIVAGKPLESSLYTRSIIDPNNDPEEKVMPPKGKQGFSKEQLEIIKWWIEKGAPASAKIKDLKPDEKMLAMLKKQKITAAPVPKKKNPHKKKETPKKEEPKKDDGASNSPKELPQILKDKSVFVASIKPIIDHSCVECHGPKKVKGKLKLDTVEHIKFGRKGKPTIVAGDLEKSEFFVRMIIDPEDDEDEELMPPADKPELKLSKDQIELFRWWIEKGEASFDKKIDELKPPANIRNIIIDAALNPPGKKEGASNEEIPPVLKEQSVFVAAIKPIIDFSCVECHGPKKVKGKLKLDTVEHIKFGRKGKPTIVAGDLEKSEFFVRMIIDPEDDEDEELMPPADKPELKLSKHQIELFRWWIEKGGASFDKKMDELNPPANIKKIIIDAAKNPPKKK